MFAGDGTRADRVSGIATLSPRGNGISADNQHSTAEPASGPRHKIPLPSSERVGRMLRDHYDVVWRTARRLGVPEARVEDVAQEVFVIASRKLELIQSGRERQFLIGVAVRVSANWRRARYAQVEFYHESTLQCEADPSPLPDELLDQKRLRELLDCALDALEEDLRAVFVLVEIEGLSGPEAGSVLDIPLGTVASRLRRARQRFRLAAARLQGARPPWGFELPVRCAGGGLQ